MNLKTRGCPMGAARLSGPGRSLICLALIVAMNSCRSDSHSTRIEVTVQIGAALALSAAHVEASAPGRPILVKDLPATGATSLTWTILISDPTDGLIATLQASGVRASDRVISYTAMVAVVRGQTVKVTLPLGAACEKSVAPICGVDETCRDGRCVNIANMKPTGDAGVDADAADLTDAPVEVGTSDAAPATDAQVDAVVGADGSCGATATDPRNCGACGHDCTLLANVTPHAAGVECRSSACYVPATACNGGYAHCTTRAEDGCETNLADGQNCGMCGTSCSGATPVCAMGTTGFACKASCAAPTGDLCGSTCVALTSDPKNCGTCGHDCTTMPNVAPGAVGIECRVGSCYIPPTACKTGFAHCSSRPDEGCEANLGDARTCGSCNTACSGAAPTCSTAAGTPACSATCTGAVPDLCGTLCADVKTDPKNCGTCGHDCAALPNVKVGSTAVTCQAGACVVPPSACVSGFAHCSRSADDGCEADLTRPQNCGRCGNLCAAPTALCSTTSSTPACSSSCVAPSPDLCGTKCVDLKSDPTNCGACGHDCTTLPKVKAGAPGIECRVGVCYVPPSACMSGFAHCSTNPDAGCEVDLTGTSNCGKCGTTCVAPTGLCSTTTSAPMCSSSCVAPSPNLCGSQCVDLTSDAANCGTCGHKCGALPNVKAGAAVQCVAGVCSIPAASCVSGYGHCTGSGDLGCETALNGCGGCGTLAGAPNAACGTCGQYTCAPDKTSVVCVGSGLPSSCSNNAPQICGANGQLVAGTACAGSLAHCAQGVCYACNADTDCPAPRANSCLRSVCTNHVCGVGNQPANSVCVANGQCSTFNGSGVCVGPQVSAGSYSIDSTEVTTGRYAMFLAAKAGSTSGQPSYCSWNTTFQPTQGWPPAAEDYDMPIGWVDWCDAYAYCAWAGKRLCGKIGGGTNDLNSYDDPALSQWMHACGGASNTGWPYGSAHVAGKCNGGDAGVFGPSAVGHFTGCVGGYAGLYDMGGNLMEWEDSCTASTGASDLCRNRGGAYQHANDDTISDRCDSNNNNARSSTDTSLGFRCCSL